MQHQLLRLARPLALERCDDASRLPWQGRFRFNWRPSSQRIYYGTAVDADGRTIDEVLLLSMLAPRSYTREDVVELHTHGGGVCAARVLRACIEAGARPARPGEFTLRAFLNGRLDLTQVREGERERDWMIACRQLRAACMAQHCTVAGGAACQCCRTAGWLAAVGLPQAENVLQLIDARTGAAADSALAGLQVRQAGCPRSSKRTAHTAPLLLGRCTPHRTASHHRCLLLPRAALLRTSGNPATPTTRRAAWAALCRRCGLSCWR